MKNEKKLTRFLKNIFLIMASAIIILFLLAQFIWDDGYSKKKPEISFLTEGASLLLSDGTQIALQYKDDYFLYDDAMPGEVITVIMTLPEIPKDNMNISIYSAEQNIGIYVDGILRAYYNEETYKLISSNSASHFVMAPISTADSGKELRITYEYAFEGYSNILACPILSTEADFMLWIFRTYFWQIGSALLLLVLGITFLIVGVVIKYNHNHNQGLCYLGIFAILMALWVLCKSNMRVFYAMNLNTTNLMTYIALMLGPIPIVIFFNDLLKYRYQKIMNGVIIACMLNTVISLAIAMSGVVDLIEIIMSTKLIVFFSCCICKACFVHYVKVEEAEEAKPISIGIGMFLIFVVVEELNVRMSNSLYAGTNIGYGIFILLMMLGYAAEKSWIVQWKDYRKAIEENAFKNEFLANVSHEIKTPINTILGMNEMILRECDDQGVKRYANHIYDAGKMLLALVNNILDYTKIEAGKMLIASEPYEMGQLLSDLVNAVNMKAEEKKLRFEVEVDEDIPSVLNGDELRIKQAVLNLLLNSLKYTREGSITLKVHAQRMDEKAIYLYISVSDTGIGIRSKDQERLFASFVRLEEKRNRSIEGAGLGLTITKQIMDMMHGEIDIRSEYGKGSTFTLTFTQNIENQQPIGKFEDWYRTGDAFVDEQKSYYVVKNVKILVVDDNEMNLEVIEGLLKKTEAQIDTVLSGEEALEKVKNQKYDLILLDHMMPGMDGIETLQHMQKLNIVRENHIPIIALTANAMIGAREEYLNNGFTDYVAKPVDYRALITILQKHLPDKIEKCPVMQGQKIVCEEYLENKGIHMKAAMKYAGDEFGQYIHLLELFSSKKGMKKQVELQKAYEQQNWKDYTTYVHGLKNGARTIGADKLADMAYKHEQRSKDGDIAFVRENYQELVREWKQVGEVIISYLALHNEEKRGSLKEENSVRGLSKRDWEDILKQIISSLSEYKKKDALTLLKKLENAEITEVQRQGIGRVVEAVNEYDYEQAIRILNEVTNQEGMG